MIIIQNLQFKIYNFFIPLWRLLRWGSPLPIPNREVKPTSADGTWSKARESMSMPILRKPPSEMSGVFCFYYLIGLPMLAIARSGPHISKRCFASLRAAVGCHPDKYRD